jgi:hypothetical protein
MQPKTPLVPAFMAVCFVLGSSVAMAQAPSVQQRAAAASATAKSSVNACSIGGPFYWEIGDRNGRAASGSVRSGSRKIAAGTRLSIASASKWIYGAYVSERAGGNLSGLDRAFLSMRSGYTNFSSCGAGQSVDGCLATRSNGEYSENTAGVFYYNGGHMQKHASMTGLGAMDVAGLGQEMQRVLGSDLRILYIEPQLAGGAVMSANDYGVFLRKMMRGELKLGAQLGSAKVCASSSVCGFQEARVSPSPRGESWSYSVGHWVEDDPQVGDGAFSSGGGLGFYPWIDASRKWYGIVSRKEANGGPVSVACGQLIRAAWTKGVAQ